jgi:hypothetical protein
LIQVVRAKERLDAELEATEKEKQQNTEDSADK